ncbi:MAG: S8 family serine peptidase [Steroidobacteraceae bacterium]
MPRRLLPVTALLALLPLLASAAGIGAPATDRVIVKWRASAATGGGNAAEIDALAGRVDRPLRNGRAIGGGMTVMHLAAPQRGAQLAATLARLRADPAVELAEPDGRVYAQAVTPSDPLFLTSQWYLRSADPAAIRADQAWESTRAGAPGAGLVVAVVDTGVRPNHPDLLGKLLPGYDFVSNIAMASDGDKWDADPTDPGDYLTSEEKAANSTQFGECDVANSTWHGTKVAGLIGASTDNGLGIAGTAFNARVLPVRVLGKCGGFESDVIAAMYWAAGIVPPPPILALGDINGGKPPANAYPAKIINLSLGGEGACSATYQAAIKELSAAGVLIVSSAGNDGGAVTSPASCEGALAVAGLRQSGAKVGYSNLGSEVGIAAPAGNCVLTGPNDPCLYALNTTTNHGTGAPQADDYSTPNYQPTFGTSFSSPLVAGTAALMKAVNPALTPALLIARIKESARAFPTEAGIPACVSPAVTPVQNSTCNCSTQVCGAGMLDAGAAVSAAQRPAALASVQGIVRAGSTLTLDGSQSLAASGRAIISWQWVVESSSAGAAPQLGNASQPVASIPSPVNTDVVLKLTVTDNLGAADVVRVTINGDRVTSSAAPPAESSGGGGGHGGTLLVLALLLAGSRLLQRTSLQR